MRNLRNLAVALATMVLAAACTYSPPRSSFEPVWYHGYHPLSNSYGRGSFCYLSGPHSHDYTPLRTHRYVFHRGYYYWVGDPQPFNFHYPTYAYYGHHPLPYEFGGYCYISGRHRHHYTPLHSHHYERRRDVYYFIGHYEPVYGEELHRHDARGRRRDRAAQGYHEHEEVTDSTQPDPAPTGNLPLAAEMPDPDADQAEAKEDDAPPEGKPRVRRPRSDRKRGREPAADAPAVSEDATEATPQEASPSKAPRRRKRPEPAETLKEVPEPSEPLPKQKKPLPRARRQTGDAKATSGDRLDSDSD